MKKFFPRPGSKDLIRKMSKHWNIVIFTSAVNQYADPIIDMFDPYNQFIKKRFYRDSCIDVNGVPIKDLRIVGDVNFAKVVIVDDKPINYSLQVENGIFIKPWSYLEERDKELLKLERVLIGLR